MPQYDWAKMTSRERDALVAEKVMGQEIPRPLLFGTPIAPYTSSISAAWEVVEKMCKQGYGVSVYQQDGFPVEAKVYLGAYAEDGEWVAEGKIAPEAIALVCLRAKGVDV